MSWQLIYTSAPRGLSSGQSGFCTVARSADLREALVQRLEQISSYHYLRVAEAATANRNPAISAFRLLDLRGTKYYVLTRIQPCGLDFTARTNHLAHHLVFLPDELAPLPSPAAILRHWPGWMASWQGEPRLLEGIAAADFAPAAKSFLPAQTWMRMTGDAGRAAGLLETECIRGCYLVCPPGGEGPVLEMFCETLQLLNPNGQYPLRPWRHPFTTFLQAEDNPADFQWRACQEGAPAWQQAVQRSAPLLPLASVRVPGNSLVKVAREGLKPPAPPQPASILRSLPASRKPPPAQPIARPVGQPAPSRRSFQTIRIQASAAIQLWFSNQSAASRASMVIAAVLLLGLIGMKYWGAKHHAAPEVVPPGSSARAPAAPAPRAGNPDRPTAEQTTSPTPASAQAEPPDAKQLDWLSADGRTFVFVTSNLTRFDLPMDAIGPLANLIQRLNWLQTYPSNIQLFVSANTWHGQPGEPMSVNAYTHGFSAQSASGLQCSFNYEDFLRNTNPVVITTALAAPPGALSVQFRFSSPTHGYPFRLLLVNESQAPAPAPLSLRWLKISRAGQAGPLLNQEPWNEILGQYTLLQGQKWQLRPFVKVGRQTKYLYEDWPAADLPGNGQELDFALVKERLTKQEDPSDAKTKLMLGRKLEEIASAVACPLGQYLGLPDPLTTFATWTNARFKTNAPPLPALFLSYLGELQNGVQKEGTDNTNNDWVGLWPPFRSEDDSRVLNRNLQLLDVYWMRNFPAATNDPAFTNNNYFSATWQKINELESLRQQEHLLQFNSVQERRKRVPDTLDDAAYVGLFITDPTQPRGGVEIIRFAGP